jgi:hypothetical protein
MALPRHAELEWTQAPEHSTVRRERDQTQNDREHTAFAKGAGDQPTQVREDEAAGADVHRARWTEQPGDKSADYRTG